MILIKTGGAKGIEDGPVLDDIRALQSQGRRSILVHGGSEETNELAAALGHPPRFVTSVSGFTSRFTDRRTMEIFTMVYCGRRNKSIVEALQQRGVDAVGLSGADGRIFEGPIKTSVKAVENGKKIVLHGDHTGKVTRVNRRLLDLLLDAGYYPVLTPPAISDSGSILMNVDGDRAAAALAAAYGAEALVILSNVPGLLKDVHADWDDPSNLVARVDVGVASDLYAHAEGRMKKKVMGAAEAIAAGVRRVIFASANTERPVQSALDGGGTHFFSSTGQVAALEPNDG